MSSYNLLKEVYIPEVSNILLFMRGEMAASEKQILQLPHTSNKRLWMSSLKIGKTELTIVVILSILYVSWGLGYASWIFSSHFAMPP